MDTDVREMVAFVEARVREDLTAARSSGHGRTVEANEQLLDLVGRVAGHLDSTRRISPEVRRALFVIAAGYSSHPGFEPRWRPAATGPLD